MRDVEQVIEGMKKETIYMITQKGASLKSQLAWYWTYIGSLDMAFMLGLIDDKRRQALYGEVKKYKLENYLITAEAGVEQNANQIDGIINNETPKPSLRDALRQYQEEARKPQGGDVPPGPSRNPER